MVDLIFKALMALAVLGVGLLAGYGGLAFAWTDLKAWAGFLLSRGWGTAAGTVTQAAITIIRTRRAAHYEPDVHYTYNVEGQTYSGQRRNFKSWSETLTQAEAERALEPYRPGAPVTVYYDRARPHWSVLEPRAPRGLLASCFVIVLLLGTSFFCLATAVIGWTGN